MHHSMALTFPLVLLCSVVAQTSADLAVKYGPPERDQYGIAPGINLEVAYGRDHAACRLVLKSSPISVSEKDAEVEPTYIASALLDRILNDLAPPALRNGKPVRTLMQSGCVDFRSEDYANVHIGISTNECHIPQTKKTQSLLIQWKRAACSNQEQPGAQARPK